jgi:hypothetical protein
VTAAAVLGSSRQHRHRKVLDERRRGMQYDAEQQRVGAHGVEGVQSIGRLHA